MTAPLLEIEGIEKSFFGVQILKRVSFSVPVGGIVGLVGENGAGKSTLMNILGGNLRPNAGVLRLAGQAYLPKDSLDAARHGIAFIHQELNLFPNLSIAENIFLTTFPTRAANAVIHRPLLRQRTHELLSEVGLDLPPGQFVGTLSAGERQLVEIAKALSLETRLIIFDEPTTALSERETKRLFELMDRLRRRGLGMIYISHVLQDVLRLCETVVVLRDGEVVNSGAASALSEEKLVSLMVGRTMHQLFPQRAPFHAGEMARSVGQPEPILDVRHVAQPGVVEDVSFVLHPGEILGIAGLMGAGRSELARILFGLDPYQTGEIWLGGERLRRLSPRDLMRRGVGFVTENRHSEGLCLEASVGDNLTLPSLGEHTRGPAGWLVWSSLQAAIRQIRGVIQLDAKTHNAQPARTLSGGNQQKVVLGKWLLRQPRVLILDEPTKGVDVGAKSEIYRLITALADGGTAVLVISSELEELLGLCDRMVVMRGGALVDTMDRPNFDRERIMAAALGTTLTP